MTKKGLISVMLCALMTFGLSGCNFLEQLAPKSDSSEGTQEASSEISTQDTENPSADDQEEQKRPDSDETVTTVLTPNTAGIKILGERYATSEGEQQINCDWTCSGVEFTLDSYGGDVVFSAGSDKPCYFRAYVNGVEWNNANSDYYTVDGSALLILRDVPEGIQSIRLIKVTGILLGNAHLYSVSYQGKILETAPAKQDVYIEFLGDSISCGWGVVGPKDHTYSAQDGSYAYPYLLSQRLNTDYSIVGLSGQGLIFHGAGVPNMTDGYLLSSPIRNEADAYDFSRKADVVVVNVGTNDYTYRQGAGITEQSFAASYKQLLYTILERNGRDCKIVCLYNTMNDTFGNVIPEVCEALGGTEAGIYSFQMTRTASGHPTVEENVAYTDALEPFIRNVIQTEKNPDAVVGGTEVWTPFV